MNITKEPVRPHHNKSCLHLLGIWQHNPSPFWVSLKKDLLPPPEEYQANSTKWMRNKISTSWCFSLSFNDIIVSSELIFPNGFFFQTINHVSKVSISFILIPPEDHLPNFKQKKNESRTQHILIGPLHMGFTPRNQHSRRTFY